MKSIEYSSEEVVQHALKSQGYEVSIADIKAWVGGDMVPPQDIAEVVEAIIKNLPWHIERFRAEKMFAPEVQRTAFTDVFQRDKKDLNNVHKASQAKTAAMQKIDLGTMYFPKRIGEALQAVAKVAGISRTRFTQNFIQVAMEMLIDATKIDPDEMQSGFDNRTQTHKLTQRQKRFARDETSRVIRFTKRVKKGVEKNE